MQRVRRAEQVQAAVWTHAAGLVPHEAALHDAQQRRDQGRGRAAAGPRAAPRAGRAYPNPDPNPNPNPNANASSSPNPNPEQAEHFLAAVRQGEVEQVQRKLVECPELILVAAPGAPTRDPGRTMWYWSPLHLALQCVTPEAEGADRMVQVVAALLRHCEKNHILLSSLKRKSDSFATPLHEAACRGARAAIVVVRRHIASVDVSSGCNLTLRTALRLNMLFEYVLCVCVCVCAGNLRCIEELLALNTVQRGRGASSLRSFVYSDPSEADLLFATTRSGWMCTRACRSNLRSHGPYSRNPMLGTLICLQGHPPLACRPIHNVCVKRSPAYARASELVPHLLQLMLSARSGAGVGEGKLVLDRPRGFKEENHCDMELLRAVTRPEPDVPPAAASE